MHDLAQHRYFRRNQHGRDFVVSDLHGRLDRLDHHLEQQAFDPECDRVFAVGDLVDRGDSSAALVERLEERWFFSVLGNHELMLLDAVADPSARVLHEYNGGRWFHQQPPGTQRDQDTLLRQHLALAFTVETMNGSLGIIHATAPSDWRTVQELPLDDAQWEELVWDRDDYNQALRAPGMIPPTRHVNRVIHGHVSCQQPVRAANRFWIDTLFRGGDITLMPVPALLGIPEHSRSSAG